MSYTDSAEPPKAPRIAERTAMATLIHFSNFIDYALPIN